MSVPNKTFINFRETINWTGHEKDTIQMHISANISKGFIIYFFKGETKIMYTLGAILENAQESILVAQKMFFHFPTSVIHSHMEISFLQ